jgi:hypothetical protein
MEWMEKILWEYPKLWFFERMLNENGVFEINKENGWGLGYTFVN